MNRYRQIIVHVGLSKTGSTSIQNQCRRHRPLLEERGIEYPVFAFAGTHLGNHSIALVTAIARKPAKYALDLKSRFGDDAGRVASSCSEQLDALLANPRCDVLVLSSERLAGLDHRDMQALRARLAPHAEQLRVIVYIRSPHSALESILQERVKAGAVVDPEAIVGRVRSRFEALQRVFPGVLEPINYHAAVDGPGGIVGSFMSLLGLAEQDIQSIPVQRENVRISMEAFQLMDAINRRYPKQGQQEHGLTRRPGDLDPLLALPGQRFQIPGFVGSSCHEAALEEARWLESRLDFCFPPLERAEPLPLWQDETLAVLEEFVLQIPEERIRRFLAEFIREQARLLVARHPGTARMLEAIASRVTP